MLVVALAGLVSFVVLRQGPQEAPPPSTTSTTPELDPVAITSDAPRFATLDELAAASDLIVRAKVRTTERGRTFGNGSAGGAIQSRLVALDVSEVLAGDVTAGELGSLLIEEEGWLEDGSPLVVDGAAPSAEGDDGIWFLVDPGDDTTDALIIVNAQGRYLVRDGRLTGAAGDDPLVAELSALSVDQLERRVSER